jgi:hypothetical protein
MLSQGNRIPVRFLGIHKTQQLLKTNEIQNTNRRRIRMGRLEI